LYFRLGQFSVEAPPLRARREDIGPLAVHFVSLFSQEMGIPAPAIEPALVEALARHDFPGNVRELKNIIERAMIQSGGGTIGPRHLQLGPPKAVLHPPAAATPAEPAEKFTDDLPLNLEAAEDVLIRRALAATGGNIAQAARRLGVNRTRIYRKLGHKTTEES
jgi:DNA-binding NtrC family response regulator